MGVRLERGLKGDGDEVVGKMKEGMKKMENHSIRLCMYLSMS